MEPPDPSAAALPPAPAERPLRLFVALYPPPEAAAGMRHLLDGLDLPHHRPVPTEQIHMTLRFLGNRAPSEIPAIIAALNRCVAAATADVPLLLTPQELVPLPSRGRPRLIALTTDLPLRLGLLHSRLSGEPILRGEQRERAGFLPHFTLCRFITGTNPHRFGRANVNPAKFASGPLALMSSTLTAAGAVHTPVHRIAL